MKYLKDYRWRNVIVFSDSDTDIEDRPPPQVFPVRMKQGK